MHIKDKIKASHTRNCITSFLRCIFFHIFLKCKLECALNLSYYFSLFESVGKHHSPQRTSDLTKRVRNFTDSEMHLHANTVH